MALGDPTLTMHGVFDVSGSDLKTAVDSLTMLASTDKSGSSLHFLPTGNVGQVSVVELARESW